MLTSQEEEFNITILPGESQEINNPSAKFTGMYIKISCFFFSITLLLNTMGFYICLKEGKTMMSKFLALHCLVSLHANCFK